MDKLKAAEILKISVDASQREIKRAYARLLREYHPEEYPEEFKKIQEAYESLKEKDSGRSDEPIYREKPLHKEQSVQRDIQQHREESVKRDVPQHEDESVQRDASQYEEEIPAGEKGIDFEKVEWKAQQEEKLRQEAAIELAGKELEMIVSSNSLKHRLASYEKFLQDERYKDILYEDRFIGKACEILRYADLKKEVYAVFADAYHFREYQPEQLKPSARRLYEIIRQHCSFTKKHGKAKIVNTLLVTAYVSLRMYRSTGASWGVAFLLLLTFVVMYNGFSKLVRIYTRWRIHMMYSLFIIVSQLIMLLGDIYRKYLGLGDNGDVLGAFLFMFGLLYFSVTVVAYVLYKVYRKVKVRTETEKNK